MWVIGLIVLAAFIAFLFFTPPMKVETAEKLMEKTADKGFNPAEKMMNDWKSRDTEPIYSGLLSNTHNND